MGPFKRALRILWRTKPRHASVGEIKARSSTQGSEWSRVVAVAPAYDRLTACTSRWLSEALVTIHCTKLIGRSASRLSLMSVLAPSEPTLLIFFGHGDSSGFLTSSDLGTRSALYEGRHSQLCLPSDLSHINSAAVFGYACSSGAFAGPHFGGACLGFSGPLPFELSQEEAFSRPIQLAVLQVLSSGRLDSASKAVLLEAYRREHELWSARLSDSAYPRARTVCMCLEEHARMLI